MNAGELNEALERIGRRKFTATVKKSTFRKLSLIKLNLSDKPFGEIIDMLMEHFDEKGNPVQVPIRPREGFDSIRE